MVDDDEIVSTIHKFNLTYLVSTNVKRPLRPKHVRECYKQYTKAMQKAEKVSNNNVLSTLGITIELVIDTDNKIAMLDPKDPSKIIREWSIDLLSLIHI